MSFRDVVLAVFVQAIWGVGLTLMKPGMEPFPPVLFIAMVYAVIAVVFTPLAPRTKTPFFWMMLIALLGGSLQSCLLAIGVSMLPASTSNLLLQSTVPFAILMSWLARIDNPNLRNGLGSVVALIGVAAVIGAPDATTAWLGIAAVTACSVSWALAQVLIRLKCQDSGMTLYTAMARHAAPQALIGSLLIERDQLGWLSRTIWTDWVGLVLIALIGFAAGYMLWYRLLARNRIDQLLPFTLLMPAMGVATSALVLHEPLPPTLLAGGAIILAGLAIIVWPQRVAPRPATDRPA
jgi:O-acetylserine/cysteine efflux transporter